MTETLSNTQRLIGIMRALRDPETGCAWDLEQTHKTLKRYVIEEAYEVAETLDEDNADAMVDELGDLLFQIVFHAQLGSEDNRFTFDDIAKSVGDKMIARHPHVFGDATQRSAEEQRQEWEEQKARERGAARTLDGVSIALPALTRALKLQKRAARVGFDWDEAEPIWQKLDEEIEEFQKAPSKMREEEFGDMLFVMVNLARHFNIDPEAALEATNRKFTIRFAHIEDALLAKKKAPQDATLEEMEALWQSAKSRENVN